MGIGEIAFRAFALLGLGTSVLLLGEYGGDASGLCTVGGGCDVVGQSGWARPGGVPLPALGIVYFASLIGVSIVPGFRQLLAPVAGVGALVGVALFAIQVFDIGAVCAFCVVVDVSALACGGLAWTLEREPGADPARYGVHAALVAGVVVAGLGVHALAPERASSSPTAGVPRFVAELARPGAVTIVEFLDFQCPACRAQHERFRTVLPDFGDRVEVVLKHLPLPQHAFAAPAARAHLCAERQDPSSTKAMADALFAAKRPTGGTLPRIATELGLDFDRLKACAGAGAITERLRRDFSHAEEASVVSLPTFWIGDERFEGVQDTETIRRAIQRALAAPRRS